MTVLSVTTANAEAEVTLDDGTVLHASHIFVAVGRRAAVEELGLDSLGLAPARGGTLAVDAHLGTSVPGVYAAGDIRGGLPFTRHGTTTASLLAMFPGFPGHTTRRVAPNAIFTDPEVARVGLDERAAVDGDVPHRIKTMSYAAIAKARETGRERGFIKLICDARREKLLGATIVGASASELIHLLSMLMHLDAPLDSIRSGIFAHPTLGEGIQSAVTALLDDREAA